MIEVTQADRLAAAQIYQRFRDHDYAKWIGDGTNAGGDFDTVIQAFARHRIAARDAALEEAAKVADEYAVFHDKHDDGLSGFTHMALGAREVAEEIRALKGPTNDPA